jgi:SAM-dependent methyltransferase
MNSEARGFELAIEALDRQKSYILSGNEGFLISLGISDKNGRVHDKRQGKFRQINKFLEHIEEIYPRLNADGVLTVYDLCSGKSYLSFAAYYYLTKIKHREVYMLSVDLKRDVIHWCEGLAAELDFSGMHFLCEDIKRLPRDRRVDMVISLHACDIATDIVIDSAIALGAEVILSTPCCHRYLNGKINNPALSFVTDYPQLSGKLCEAFTDAIRLKRLEANGYKTVAKELTDPENTPKNTLLCAYKTRLSDEELIKKQERYKEILNFVLGDKAGEYLENI